MLYYTQSMNLAPTFDMTRYPYQPTYPGILLKFYEILENPRKSYKILENFRKFYGGNPRKS